MRKMHLLVVDDSVVVRRILVHGLLKDPNIEVVDTAPNGRIALAKIAQNPPDLVTLDLEMPEMGGLETLARLREDNPLLPVIVFRVSPDRPSHAADDALVRERVDYLTKPSDVAGWDGALKTIREILIPKIKRRMSIQGRKEVPVEAPGLVEAPSDSTGMNGARAGRSVEIVVIGASIGGPDALAELLPCIPSSFPVPILIVQHMPAGFTGLLAERLAARSRIHVAEATSDQILEPGHAWLAPGASHMIVEKSTEGAQIRIHKGEPENSCRPSVDVLFRSAASAYGPRVLAVIMTGMGRDGAEGCDQIRKKHGQILIQDEESSVVWGMPRFAARAGLGDVLIPLCRLGPEIVRRVNQYREQGLRSGSECGPEVA
jgi:two-component system chemotaxis response regulator CheB